MEIEKRMRPASEIINVFEGCDPSVALGIETFTHACTSSYTTGSKPFSIWTLIRQYVEPPLSIYLRDHGRLTYPDCFGRTGLAGAMKRDLYNVEQSLRFHIRLSMQTQWDKTFQATLESVLYLGYFCKGRIPKRSVGKGVKRGSAQKTVRPNIDVMHSPFCELCWRLCQSEEVCGQYLEGVRRSRRFCSEHDPKDLNSRYRTDHNQRQQFHAKLKEIFKELPYQRDKWNELAGDIDWTSIRRYAYEFVHSHPVDNRLEVARLSNAGRTNSEIVKLLGMSRQRVHKILNHPFKSALGRTAQGKIIYYPGGATE